MATITCWRRETFKKRGDRSLSCLDAVNGGDRSSEKVARRNKTEAAHTVNTIRGSSGGKCWRNVKEQDGGGGEKQTESKRVQPRPPDRQVVIY